MSPTFQLHDSPIFFGPLAEAFPVWLEKQNYSKVFVLTDENTHQHCLPGLAHASPTDWEEFVLPAGENFKTLASCEKTWQAMLAAQLDRQSLLVNLGGGVVGDMGGFCAATWKRGIDFVQIPTTLLAMTDAAIGGKTGIDFQGVKNTIGIFRQPTAVFIDPVFLRTLPERELRSGYAEVIKHAVIGDLKLGVLLSESFKLSESRTERWLDTLQKSVDVKVRIVQEDPLEKGLRMLLNFGHTIGHALESYFLETGEPLTHGEAVYIGMVCEAEIAPAFATALAGKGGRKLRAEVLALGQKVFPHRSIPDSAFPAIWELMRQDKKKSSGTVRMAVPDEEPFSMRIIELTKAEVGRGLAFYNSL